VRSTPAGAGTETPPGLDVTWVHPVLGRLLRAQRQLRRAGERHPWLPGSAVLLCLAIAALPDIYGQGEDFVSVPTGPLLVLAAALVIPLWWRRRAPAATCVAVLALCVVQVSVGLWLQAGLSLLVALCSLALYGSLLALGATGALAVAALSTAVLVPPVAHRWTVLPLLLGTMAGAVALGLAVRVRRLYLAALEERVSWLDTDRDQRVRLTAAAERSRIAREMHDIVGHHLAIMIGLADGAAALAPEREQDTARVLRIIGDTGREALGELRSVLGVLRPDADDGAAAAQRSPQPGLGDLDALLDRARATGLGVTLRTTGDLDALGSGVQLAVYRIIQEALTNTLKHAGQGSTTQITVTAEDRQVRVRATDSGPPANARPAAAEPAQDGHGLVGIRERAALYGGTVTMGPRTDGRGWIVEAVIRSPAGPEATARHDHAPGEHRKEGCG
jgi:signal transduction histidine kinase